MNTETQNYEQERKILDSGNRRQFDSGAVRDIAEGKGRCDLLPLDVVADLYSYFDHKANTKRYLTASICLREIDKFIRNGDYEAILEALVFFRPTFFKEGFERGSNLAGVLLNVSKHYEEGAKKYSERNWEKGIPCHCYVDSGVRHLIKWADGWEDEPHDRAFVWNMLGLLWTVKHHPDLIDLPYFENVPQPIDEEDKNYIKKDVRVNKDTYNRLTNNVYDNPMQAVEDVNELVEALEKGEEK